MAKKLDSKDDFSRVSLKHTYVDKSLLVREMMHDDAKVIRVTAPRSFGKTVNLKMLKSFFEIETDNNGVEIANKTNTTNYKLFERLYVFKRDKKFFDANFGQHPVVYVDMKPFGLINDFSTMLVAFRRILLKTYQFHRYMMLNYDFWTRGRITGLYIQVFKKYMFGSRTKYLDEKEVQLGFPYLCKTLYAHFNKTVLLLVDEYDSFYRSLVYTEVSEVERIRHFLRETQDFLFGAPPAHIEKVFLTGVLSIGDVVIQMNVTRTYPFLHDHCYGDYYGLTVQELYPLIRIETNKTEKFKKLKNNILNFCGGYIRLGKKGKLDESMFNPATVAGYLYHRWLRNFGVAREYLKKIICLLHSSDLEHRLVGLLKGQGVTLYKYRDLSAFDLNLLKSFAKDDPEKTINDEGLQLVYNFFLQLGFFTYNNTIGSVNRTWTTGDSEKNGMGYALQFANMEVQFDMRILLSENVIHHFPLCTKTIDAINSILKNISKFSCPDESFVKLQTLFCKLLEHSVFTRFSWEDYHSSVISLFRYRFRKNMGGKKGVAKRGSLDVFLKNRNDIFFIIETAMTNRTAVRNCTYNATLKSVEKGFMDIFHEDTKKKKLVYLGICYSRSSRNVGIGYSRLLKRGDHAHDIKVVGNDDYNWRVRNRT